MTNTHTYMSLYIEQDTLAYVLNMNRTVHTSGGGGGGDRHIIYKFVGIIHVYICDYHTCEHM